MKARVRKSKFCYNHQPPLTSCWRVELMSDLLIHRYITPLIQECADELEANALCDEINKLFLVHPTNSCNIKEVAEAIKFLLTEKGKK